MLCSAQPKTGRFPVTARVNSHDAFIAALSDKLSQEPSVSLNSNCLSERRLYSLLDQISAQCPRPQPTKKRTKEWLTEIGLLTAIVIDEYPERGTRNTKFYRLDLSRKTRAQPNPFELLQAYAADGVVCYFSAVAFHSLTTQPPAHHHVAIPTEPRPRITTPSPELTVESRATRRKAEPLGEWLFTYKGLRYYQTSRDKKLIPGIQTRFLGPTSLVRITTLEQTLLDTLHRPLSCGGPAVVMEAWEQGIRRAKEDVLAQYLREMDRLPIAQRLGHILSNLDYKPRSELERTLESYLKRLDPNDPSMYQQLFPGLRYEHLQHPWLVYGPA